MADTLGMAAHAAGHALRTGWYLGLNQIVDWSTRRMGRAAIAPPTQPLPTLRALLADLAQLHMRDAAAVRDGIYPPMADERSALEPLARAVAMLADMPANLRRRNARDATTAQDVPESGNLPDYFTQDFHFQTGGYLTEQSARLYDTQVETLFYGAAAPMRREALRPIAEFVNGQDQRQVRLLDVACGTGRFLRSVRLAYPAMRLAGLDLSAAYLDEARRHMGRLRPAELIAGNAEAIPLPDASCDIVTTIFLFHELPAQVRRRVAAEMARVLRPGGLLVLVDSLQPGDRPRFDGLLELFPARFHEPYYRGYLADDLAALLDNVGLVEQSTGTAFLSKVMARRKTNG